MRISKAQRSLVDGEPAPDRVDEYRFFQALLGVWPADLPPGATRAPDDLVERLSGYMIKAVKEAKVHTSWLSPNQPYEDALRTFVQRVLGGTAGVRLVAACLPFQQRIAALGMINSLAQVALKIGSPGVPDFYQGTEMWDLSLVDPDNRRPVDFARRSRALEEVEDLLAVDAASRATGLAAWVTNWTDGRIKLLVTAAGLRVRSQLPHVFLGGRYLPLATEISVPGGAVAFARTSSRDDGDAVLVMTPRLCSRLVTASHPAPLGGECWKTSRVMLPPGLRDRDFRDVITGADIRPTRAGEDAWIFLGEAFQTLPVAILRAV
jgi:(1->4)-alpha-D-glucan 1-alpha-D-glucosylmutase